VYVRSNNADVARVRRKTLQQVGGDGPETRIVFHALLTVCTGSFTMLYHQLSGMFSTGRSHHDWRLQARQKNVPCYFKSQFASFQTLTFARSNWTTAWALAEEKNKVFASIAELQTKSERLREMSETWAELKRRRQLFVCTAKKWRYRATERKSL